MAPKKAEKIENPPVAVSSSEEESGEESNASGEESDSDVEESEKEESEKRVVKKSEPERSVSKITTNVAALPTNPPMAVSSSEEEEEEEAPGSCEEESNASGEETNSDVEESEKEESEKRVVSKSEPERSVSKITTNVAALPAKRSLEKGEEKSKKKMKKTEEKVKRSDSVDEKPKPPSKFQKIFTDEDEIILLQSIPDYIGTNAKLDNMDAFGEFVKGSLSFDPHTNQLKTKVRKLKDKFNKTVEKSLKKGITDEDQIVFSNVHSQKCFDLSRKIWGVKGVLPPKASMKMSEAKSSKSEKKVKGKLKEEAEIIGSSSLSSGREIASLLTGFGFDESTLIERWDMVEDGPKKKNVEEKLKEIKAMQEELGLKKIELLAYTAKMMFGDNASTSGK